MKKAWLAPLTGLVFIVLVIVGFIVQGEPPQEAAVGAEHIVQKSRREKLFDCVPTQVEMAPALIDLMIEIHLRRLTHTIGDLAYVVGRLPPWHPRRERAGEYHWH